MKHPKTVLILLVILVVGGGALAYRHYSLYIGAAAALNLALEDAGVHPYEAEKADVDFELTSAQAWYQVEFRRSTGPSSYVQYDYRLDAVTGAVLSASAQACSTELTPLTAS